MADALLQTERLTRALRRRDRGRRHRARPLRRAKLHADHRAQRRRQDHADRPAQRRDRPASRAASASTAPRSPGCRSIAAASLGWRARSRSPRCFAISRRSTMSRSPCRRIAAIRSASGATRGARRRLRGPALAALDRVGLRDRAATRVDKLSHGEQRQLEIAMALASGAAAAPARRADGRHGARRVRRAWCICCASSRAACTILLIEHDMEAVFALADRLSVLVYGRIIASGDAGGDPGRRRPCGRPISAKRTRAARGADG